MLMPASGGERWGRWEPDAVYLGLRLALGEVEVRVRRVEGKDVTHGLGAGSESGLGYRYCWWREIKKVTYSIQLPCYSSL